MLKSIVNSNKSIKEKIFLLKEYNSQKYEKNNTNCIYGLDNKQYNNNYIKIGSTTQPEKRKYDYQTSSPHPYKYLWLFYLEDFNCLLVDDLIKIELQEYNVKNKEDKNVGIEFYKINNYKIVEDILKKYEIKYNLEIGDKYDLKIDLNDNNLSNQNFKMNPDSFLKIFESLTPQQLEYLNQLNNNEEVPNDLDITNYKYQYINNKLKTISDEKVKEIDCQSINFFIDKLKNQIKNIIILGLIQSGKTKEIIGLLHFCIKFLKIPVIIIIQNKTSGYYQLEERIKNFSKQLKDFNINCSYVKNGLNKKNSLKTFSSEEPIPKVFIALSNYIQLRKIKDNFDNITQVHNKRLAPYVLIMDEYDDLIKSRMDEVEPDKQKRIEQYSKFLQKNAYINVGVTATLIGIALSEENIRIQDIFHIKPNNNYIGFGNKRIKVIDIEKHITNNKNKRELHLSKVRYLLQQIENSIYSDISNDKNKDYSITLINITDNKKEHIVIQTLLENEFNEWAGVLFHSTDENKICCNLPLPEYSSKEIVEGIYIDKYSNRLYTIDKKEIKIPSTHPMAEFCSKEDMSFYRYSIEYENYSISDVITDLILYTNKVCIISGRMACRGISFVSKDYKHHITDMIYVPSGSSHLTRNVQDMRIYGNFPNDGIDINIYVDEKVYFKDIGEYIKTQEDILSNNPDTDISLKEAMINYDFDESNVPRKKLDRIGVVKGFAFNPSDKWGIPTNLKNYEDVEKLLRKKYPDYKIITYSKFVRLDLNKINQKFKIPKQTNDESRKYKILFNTYFKNDIEKLGRTFIDKNYILNIEKIWYIYSNFRNAWLLHNPLSITKETVDLSYLADEDSDYIDIILKNDNYSPTILQEYQNRKQKNLIIFYGRNSYHYTRSDINSYYIVDKKKFVFGKSN